MKKRKQFMRLWSLMLLLIAMLMPQRAWAENFISEVKISVYDGKSGDTAKNRLINDRYTLVDTDLNQGGGGHYVYIGYKTSTNAADAITGLLIVESSSGFDCHAIANITTSAFTYNGKKYYRCTNYDAGDARLDCDLNRGRGSGTPDITLYYTKDGNTANGGTLLTSISVVGNTTTTGVTYTRHWKYNDAQDGTTNDDVYGNTNKGGTAHYITYATHNHAFSDADYDTNTHKLWCASCGYVSAYNAHVWENTGSKISDATCTQAAKYYQKCKWCKRTGDDNHFYTTSALGHGTNNTGYTPTWTWGGRYNAATCTFALKCNRCKQEVSKQNLTPTKVTNYHVDPTCVKDGNERWTVAAVSYSNSKTNDASYTGSAQTNDYAISALGHTFAANDLAKSACQRCNHGFFRYKSTTGKAVVLTAYDDAVFLDENDKTLDYTNTYVDGNGVMECERPIVTIVSSSFRESKGFTGDLIIPNTVKTIGSRAFELTEFNGNLIIPNSVTSIGEQAFCECKNLTGDITIPNSVTSLEFRTFYKCSGFNGTLSIPNSITRIERDVFFECKGLTGNLTIPNSVTSIGQSAFYHTGFTGNLSIPNSVTSIGNEAFSYCEKLSGTLTLPNSITSIGDNAFSHCPGLTGNLTIPNSVTSIGDFAFYGTGFTGNLTIPNSVISIGNHAFRECKGLTGTLTLGNSVKSIGSEAFLSARLTGVLAIPNSVTEIGNSAFWGCKGFTCVTFESVPKVGNYAFGDITTNMSANLCASSYVYKGSDTSFPTVNSVTAPCTLDLKGSAVENHSNLTINHGESAVDEAVAATCTATGLTEGSHCDACHEVFVAQEVIPALGHTFAVDDPGHTYCSVCEHTFFRYTAKNKVTPGDYTLRDSIGNNIYNSDKHTFADGQGVMEFDEPLATIGEKAFFMCDKFTGNLTIPNSVTSIGNSAFSGCSGFTGDLTIPNSVTRIGNYAFSDCSGFTGVEFQSVPYVEIYAFSNVNCAKTVVLTNDSYVYTDSNPYFPEVASVTAPCTFDLKGSAVENHPNLIHTNGEKIVDASVAATCTTTGLTEGTHCNLCEKIFVAQEVIPALGHTFADNDPGQTYCPVCEHTFFRYTAKNKVTPKDGTLLDSIGNNIYNSDKHTFADGQGVMEFDKPLATIGDYAFCFFFQSSDFTGNLTIPNSVTCIGNSAFVACSGFNGNLSIPNSVTSIGNNAFEGCSGFIGNLTIPNSVTSIGNSAFNGCKSFSGNLTIPDSVTSIGSFAFYGCSGFTGVEFQSVPYVDEFAFNNVNCSKAVVLTDDSYLYTHSNPYFPEVASVTAPCTLDLKGSAVENHPNLVHTNGERIVDASVAATCTTTGLTEGTHCNLCNKPLVAQEVIPALGHTFADNDPGQTYCPVCEHTFFRYTAKNKVTPKDNTLRDAKGRNIYNANKHTFADGQGVMEFDKPLATIGESAFEYCHAFTGSLTIPSTVKNIDKYAFNDCDGFSGTLTIPESVTNIGNLAFRCDSGFTGDLIIPNSVITIGPSAFEECSGFTGDLIISNSVEDIDYSTFRGCSGFKGSLTLSSSLIGIRSNLFDGCSGFIGKLVIPSSIRFIASNAFRNCTGFTSVEIASVPDVYSSSAFEGVTSSKTVVLTDDSYLYTHSNPYFPEVASVTAPCTLDLKGSAVENHPNLVHTNGERIVDAAVAATCTTTGLTEGAHCNLCEKIFVAQEVIPATGIHTFADDDPGQTYCPVCEHTFFRYTSSTNGAVTPYGAEALLGADGRKLDFTNTYVDGQGVMEFKGTLKTIGNNAFKNCLSFTGDLIIPNSVTSIGKSAFQGCYSFKGNLTIPNSVISIGVYAFGGCNGFKGNLTIPNSVTSIGHYAFQGCYSFKGNLTIPNSVTSIGYGAFYGCSGFTGNLTIPNSVTSIGNDAFYYCKSFTGVEFLSVPSVGIDAFSNVNCTKTVVLSDDSYVYIDENPDFPEVASVTYNRNLAAGKTVTFMLPFDVPVENINGKVYELSGFDGETLSFSKPADGIAHANKPYLLAEPEEGNLMISPVSTVSAGNPQTIAADNAEMWGTYTKQTGIFSTDRESIYGYAGGEFVRQQSVAEGATKGATLKPFRALIKVRELENGAPAARLALSLDEETIGVISISDDELNTRPVNVYDMNGRLVRSNVDPMTCLQGLPKGMYVVKTLSAPQGGTSPMMERVVYKQKGE